MRSFSVGDSALFICFIAIAGISLVGFKVLGTFSQQISEESAEGENQTSHMEAQLRALEGMIAKMDVEYRRQSSDLLQISNAFDEIAAVFSEVVNGIDLTIRQSHEMQVGAAASLDDVATWRVSMKEMEEAQTYLESFSAIVEVIAERVLAIDSIVFKTQLLSFNAAIEAALAGSSGRGFAVVAEEVGRLAADSGRAAQDIAALIVSSRKQAADAVSNIHQRIEGGRIASVKCTSAIERIHRSIIDIGPMIDSIKQNAELQAEGLAGTRGTVEKIRSRTDQAEGSFKSITSMIDNLKMETTKRARSNGEQTRKAAVDTSEDVA